MKRSKRTIRREKKKNEEIQRSLDIQFAKMKIAATHGSSYHVPDDLIPDILSRLPAKSIVRFRAVSKFWYSITTTPEFITSFASRSSTEPPSLILTFQTKKTRWEVKGEDLSFNSNVACQLVFSFPQNQNHPHASFKVYQMTNASEYLKPPKVPRYWRFESVHGLVLLPDFVIWNPTTRQFFTLPKPTATSGKTYLSYDPIEGKHKVVHLSEKPQVLTLGAQESWRIISQGTIMSRVNEKSCEGRRGRCFNGILYYNTFSCLMSFDVRSEKFNPPIKHPEHYAKYPLIIPYEGSLALVTPRILPGNEVVLCILEDADNHKWTRRSLLLPRRYEVEGIFQGVTDAGELIFTSWYRHPSAPLISFSILYFDPKRKSIRDSLFTGPAECECDYDIFPNHIESLFSM